MRVAYPTGGLGGCALERSRLRRCGRRGTFSFLRFVHLLLLVLLLLLVVVLLLVLLLVLLAAAPLCPWIFNR
jgi:hypothetical protein